METSALHPAPVLLTCLLIQLNPDGPKRAEKQRLETSVVRPALFSEASDSPESCAQRPQSDPPWGGEDKGFQGPVQ